MKQVRGIDGLRRAFRRQAPCPVTQEAFDGDAAHLRRLAALTPGQPAAAGDLWDYMQDLRYTDIDGPLLIRLLPTCLQAWHDDLHGSQTMYRAFVEHFYPVLADRRVFDACLTPGQTAAVSEFMRQSILEEIDDQRGLAYRGMNARPYRWIPALTTYGVLLTDIDILWTRWWSLETIGRAIALVQYASVLMYADDENPIFAAWTCDGGGGPPCLWDFDGHLYSHRWLQPNVEFLKQTLTAAAVRDGLGRAVERLANEPEHGAATRLHAEVPARATILERRCRELPAILGTTQEPGTLPTWSL